MKHKTKLKLYKLDKQVTPSHSEWPDSYMGFRLILYKPGILSLGNYNCNTLLNLMWYIATAGRLKILLLLDNNEVVHYSYITPKTYRFPFMQKDDLMIGPCYTAENQRGKGIFTEVLKLINSVYDSYDLWLSANLNNTASHKAFERSGYRLYSLVEISHITKIVRIIQ